MEARNNKIPRTTTQAFKHGIAKSSPTSESAFNTSLPQPNVFFSSFCGDIWFRHPSTSETSHLTISASPKGNPTGDLFQRITAYIS